MWLLPGSARGGQAGRQAGGRLHPGKGWPAAQGAGRDKRGRRRGRGSSPINRGGGVGPPCSVLRGFLQALPAKPLWPLCPRPAIEASVFRALTCGEVWADEPPPKPRAQPPSPKPRGLHFEQFPQGDPEAVVRGPRSENTALVLPTREWPGWRGPLTQLVQAPVV